MSAISGIEYSISKVVEFECLLHLLKGVYGIVKKLSDFLTDNRFYVGTPAPLSPPSCSHENERKTLQSYWPPFFFGVHIFSLFSAGRTTHQLA